MTHSVSPETRTSSCSETISVQNAASDFSTVISSALVRVLPQRKGGAYIAMSHHRHHRHRSIDPGIATIAAAYMIENALSQQAAEQNLLILSAIRSTARDRIGDYAPPPLMINGRVVTKKEFDSHQKRKVLIARIFLPFTLFFAILCSLPLIFLMGFIVWILGVTVLGLLGVRI